MGIFCISVDGTVIFKSFVEEIEFDDALASVLITLATDKPIIGTFRLPGDSDIVSRLCLQVFLVVPVAGDITDELEGIVEAFIVLGQVGSHL